MTSEAMQGKTALQLLSMGSKSFWLRKYNDAATYLSRSSEMLVEEHKDDKHNSLGNVYLYYGKTLLELAREDGDPLGDAVPKEVGVEDDGSDEDDDGEDLENGTVEGEESDKEAEAGVDGDKAEEGKEENKTDDAKAANISINGEAASSTSTENSDEAAGEVEGADDAEADADAGEEVIEDAGEGGSGEKPEDEEPTDLQLAWEVLELAKLIFERRGEEGREDYADCLVTLGEVSLESENFDSAIADISSGLDIQKEIYTDTKDMRKLAETYYKLGMALAAHNKIDEGVANYEVTLEILGERLKVLQALEEPGSSDKEEIKDIKNLMPDLQDKVSDLKNYKEEAEKKPEEDPPIVSSPEKKANNITHLVKRKRKLEEVAEEAAEKAAAKKPSL